MKSTLDIFKAAKAAIQLACLNSKQKDTALLAMARGLEEGVEEILTANALDVENAQNTISPVMIDRLRLNKERVFAMATGIRDVAKLPDPVGAILEEQTLPNGLLVTKKRVPLGVIGIIYESRPNVTSDAAALCFKSGNVCVLRGGKDAFQSSFTVAKVLRKALLGCGLNPDFIQVIEDVSRDSAKQMMSANGYIDVLIPRGGAGLIQSCIENATVPCIQTGTGICHIFVDEHADFEKALAVIENAKTSRPSVCNAAEVCLIHENILPRFLPLLYQRLTKREHPVSFRCDEKAFSLLQGEMYATKAIDEDFDTEFLDYILAIKSVSSVEEAIIHINEHSTKHSDCILSKNKDSCEKFAMQIDSAAVYVNASTRFTDGGELGKGCEIGISTQKLPPRGPMGLEELCSYKYIIKGEGQVR